MMSPRHRQDSLPLQGDQQEAFDHWTVAPDPMEPLLNDFKFRPEAMKALAGLDQQIARSGLEKSLVELVRLRASQINGCAYCLDGHTADARKAAEGERRLATVAVWRETPFFNDAQALGPASSALDGALSVAFRAEARPAVTRRWQRRRAGATFAARLLQHDAGAPS